METSVLRFGLSAAVLLCTSCAPTVRHLVATRSYEEALCAATRFSNHPDDAKLVRDALARDADPAIHIHAVTKQELERAYGQKGIALHEKLLLLRVVSDTNEVSAGRYFAHVDVVSRGAQLPTVPSSRESLAAYAGEFIPRTETTAHAPSLLDRAMATVSSPTGMLAGAAEAATLGTVPVLEMSGRVHTTYSTSTPTEEDYRRASPVTESLYNADLTVWKRPASDEVSLGVRWGFEASSYDGACTLEDRVVIALPPGGSLEDRINSVFGNEMRRMRELRLGRR